MKVKERTEWAPFGTLSSYPLGDERVFIAATCNICGKWWRRRSYASARRTLRRHWSTILADQSGDTTSRSDQ